MGLSPGDVVAGRYRIEETLGEGGFGTVFRATQLNLDRGVALKVLHPELRLSDRGLERFRREARLAQALEHPNTVRLFDFGETAEGVPFIAWELLRGRPLDRLLAEDGPFAPARVVRIATQVLKSLMEAHGRGVVHRDVKPQNVFVSDFQGEPDFVKVLDFGVAKPDPSSPGEAQVTREGELVGTPSYMAPEAVRGEGVGPPADLYALGLVMAELLSGSVVVTGRSQVDVIVNQMSERPVPLPEEVVSGPLGEVVVRATAKPLEDRFRSAEAMLEALLGAGRASPDDPAWHRPSKAPSRAHGPMALGPTVATPPGEGPAGEPLRDRGSASASGPWVSGPFTTPSAAFEVSAVGEGPADEPKPRSGLPAGLTAFIVAAIVLVLAGSVGLVSASMMCHGCLTRTRSDARVAAAPWSPFPPAASPEALAASARPVTVATGSEHACAVVEDGGVFCWGANDSGQLGDGTTRHRPLPVRVQGLGPAVEVGVGSASTCALLRDATVLCWGAGDRGQLGTGRAAGSPTPVAVVGLGDARGLAVGDDHACALTAAGEVLCWGSNFRSQLGQAEGMHRATPTSVPGLRQVVEVAAGGAHSCARLTDRTVRCWGEGSSGRLGDGELGTRTSPVRVAGLTAVASLSLGDAHGCALLEDGTARCWGEGDAGQLGRPGDSAVPAALPLEGIRAIAAGARSTCALLHDGTVVCMGDNARGRLGLGPGLDIVAPSRVPGLEGIARIGGGGELVCAVGSEAFARCFGLLARRGRGAEPLVYAPTPTAVAFAPGSRGSR